MAYTFLNLWKIVGFSICLDVEMTEVVDRSDVRFEGKGNQGWQKIFYFCVGVKNRSQICFVGLVGVSAVDCEGKHGICAYDEFC